MQSIRNKNRKYRRESWWKNYCHIHLWWMRIENWKWMRNENWNWKLESWYSLKVFTYMYKCACVYAHRHSPHMQIQHLSLKPHPLPAHLVQHSQLTLPLFPFSPTWLLVPLGLKPLIPAHPCKEQRMKFLSAEQPTTWSFPSCVCMAKPTNNCHTVLWLCHFDQTNI